MHARRDRFSGRLFCRDCFSFFLGLLYNNEHCAQNSRSRKREAEGLVSQSHDMGSAPADFRHSGGSAGCLSKGRQPEVEYRVAQPGS